MLLIDGVKYEVWIPPNEDEFEQVVKEHAKDIFGEQSIYLDIKTKLKSKLGTGSVPDGFLIFFGDVPQWRIVEVELSGHPLHDHIVAQVGRFINGIENPSTQRGVVNAIDEEIRKDDFLTLRLREAIEPTEIYRFLINLISKQPILTIIIEEATEELRAALNILRYPQIEVVEFQTFVGKGVEGLPLHAHLFEPLYETPRRGKEPPHKGREGGKYPLSTSVLLAKYGDRPSKVGGMTWRQLYDSNTDGNFRYFKVRMPLIELDKKETQREEA